MLLIFTEESVSAFINVIIIVSDPAALCIFIKFFLKLSLIFTASFFNIVNSDASVMNSCKFSLFFYFESAVSELLYNWL